MAELTALDGLISHHNTVSAPDSSGQATCHDRWYLFKKTSSRGFSPRKSLGIGGFQQRSLSNNQRGITTSCLQWAASGLGTLSLQVCNVLSVCTTCNQNTLGSCSAGEFRDDDKSDRLSERRPEKAETALPAPNATDQFAMYASFSASRRGRVSTTDLVYCKSAMETGKLKFSEL